MHAVNFFATVLLALPLAVSAAGAVSSTPAHPQTTNSVHHHRKHHHKAHPHHHRAEHHHKAHHHHPEHHHNQTAHPHHHHHHKGHAHPHHPHHHHHNATSVAVSSVAATSSVVASSAPASTVAATSSHVASPSSVHVVPGSSVPAQASSSAPVKASSSAAPSKSSSAAAKPSSSSTVPNLVNSDDAVNDHNNFRAHYQAGALTWNQSLADGAAEYAAQCKFQHSGGAYGENLAAGTGDYTFDSGFNGWTSENTSYSVGTYSHFTQVVWKGTSQVGCGGAQCAGGTIFDASYGTSNYYVCRYLAPGNVVGEDAQNVGTWKN